MRWAFTFGQAYDLHNKYVIVEADTETEACRTFVTTRKQITEGCDAPDYRWAFCYPFGPEFEIQIERYELSEVPIDTPIRWRDDANRKE